MGFSLQPNQLAWLDETTHLLNRHSPIKVSRSFVVQKAILHLKQDLDGKSPKQISRLLLEQAETGDKK